MMGVYIAHIQMPKCCAICKVRYALGCKIDDKPDWEIGSRRLESCPLVFIQDAKLPINYGECGFEIMQWIPVSERLPKNNERVLCCTDYDLWIADFRVWNSGGYDFVDYEGNLDTENVIAWQPVPEIYKPKK